MAKQTGTVGFEGALAHIKAGKKINKRAWEKEFLWLRIDDTGLGNSGEFMRMDINNRMNRYIFSTADLLDTDYVLL